MSEKSERLRQKARQYRDRQARLSGKKAVSPVVATLILILIAVAAAAFLYLWLVVWQGNLTGGIGQPHAQSILSVGGSTSAYPFASTAATWFEQNQSDVVVSVNQGGTGAGMLAVCAGSIQIGTASTPETPAGLITSDGCPSADLNTIQVNTVAYDAVDVIVPVANDHGLVSVGWDTLTAVYDGSTIAQGGTATLQAPSINAVALSTLYADGATSYISAGGKISAALAWDQIPAAVEGATVQSTTETSTGAVGGTLGTTYAACGSDLCSATPTDATPCGFNVCAGGTGAGTAAGEYGATIVTVARSDAGGDTQTFESRILGATSSSAFATSFTGLGFTGCGSNNLISDCGLIADKTAVGDSGVISTVSGTPDAIGYASDGLARASSSGVTCQGVATTACGIGVEAPSQGAAVQPALGSTGSIAGGIINGGFGPSGATTTLTIAESYSGARPFEFVSLQPYTGVAQEFLTFIQDPANNIALAAASHEVSIYSV